MATVHRIQPDGAAPSLGQAVAAFCDTLDVWGTRQVYAGTQRALLGRLDPAMPVASLASRPRPPASHAHEPLSASTS